MSSAPAPAVRSDPLAGPLARSGLADLFGGAAIAAAGVGFLVASARIPLTSPLWQWYTSPGIYPLATALVTTALALVVAFRGWRRWRAGRRTMPWAGLAAEAAGWGAGRLAWFVLLVVGFLAMLGRLPFWASTSVFVLVTVLTTSRNARASLKPALVGVAVVYLLFVVIFQVLFGIPLP